MAPHKTISYVSTLLLLITLAFTSCSKDSDLFDATVESQIEEEKDKQLDENGQLIPSVSFEAMDDEFTISGNVGSSTLDVLKNDNVQETESFQIVEVSEPAEGTLTINADNTLTYTPAPDSANKAGNNGIVSDNFTYTLEARKGGNTGKKTASVVVNTQYGDTDMGALKAFPGAEGFGRNATGGRGGIVYRVTNLNNSGEGSLRYGLTNIQGPRTIVFNVGGTIWLDSPLKISAGYGDVTIAGQTAPGEGITIAGSSFWINDSNVIIRYLRIRPGHAWDYVDQGQYDDVMRINSKGDFLVQNVILDHCSFSWGKDEIIEIGANGSGRGVTNVTIQKSIIAENIRTGYGLILWKRSNNISIIQNLFAHNTARCIESTTHNSSFEMINNIIYGNTSVTRLVYQNKGDIINNYYKSAPYDSQRLETVRLELGPSGENPELTEVFVEGNELNNSDISISSIGSNDLYPFLKNVPVLNSGSQVLSLNELKQTLPNIVGSSIVRDDADKRIVNDFLQATGRVIESEVEVGGFPSLNSVSHPNSYDTDSDGMADDWEIRTFGTLSKKHNEDDNGDGYTNLEEFLHSLTITIE